MSGAKSLWQKILESGRFSTVRGADSEYRIVFTGVDGSEAHLTSDHLIPLEKWQALAADIRREQDLNARVQRRQPSWVDVEDQERT